jgi:protein-L-isoaspartate(D-aspartate) O-methyltransferase
MDQAIELDVIRRAFARQILAEVQVNDRRIEAAFATVPREDFLGSGPWIIPRWLVGFVPTPTSDPVYVYVDNVVQIIAERHLNNGVPSAHVKWIDSAKIEKGEHIVHVGAGTGYYTAIIAHLVGRSGKVTAIEFDPMLAARAQLNLARLSNVHFIHGDGANLALDAADVIYVSAGATRPTETWLNGLSDGGRLIVPLTTNKGYLDDCPSIPLERRGAMFRIERRSHAYFAQWISPAAFIPCAGARDAASEVALAHAFKNGGWERVTRLYRDNLPAEDRCWLRASGWALAFS